VKNLSVTDLSKAFPRQGEVLRGVTLHVAARERFVLLGPSGSGKTTLLRLVAGLETPDAGDVRLGNASLLGRPAEQRGFGVVLQDPLLFPHLSVAGNVAFGLRMRGVRAGSARERVREVLERVGLPGFEQRRPSQLSGGQAQRVALARALVTNPDVLLLDEPFSALDAPLRRSLRAWLVSLQRSAGTTMVFVTHDQEEAVAVADRVGLLIDGKLAQVGTPESLYARPASERVARFFGGVNFLPAVQSGTRVRTALGVFEVSVQREGPVTFTVRPEAITAGAGANAFQATVTAREFAGTFTLVRLSAAGVPLTWHAPPHVPHHVGDILTLHCPTASCWTIPPQGPA